MKTCSICTESKDESNFTKKVAELDGLYPQCKPCKREEETKRRHNKKGFISNVYSRQIDKSKKRGHVAPSYDLVALRQWLYAQESFHEIFDVWKASGFSKWLAPSINRLESDLPYSLLNIEIGTWQDNANHAYAERKSWAALGNYNRHSCVFVNPKTGEVKHTFVSLAMADRELGLSRGRTRKAVAFGRKINGLNVIITAKGV
jgi:hypothetical protein